MIICFSLAGFYALFVFAEPSIIALSLFLGVLGVMFLVLDRTPKGSQYILGKPNGLKKGMFKFLSILLACVLFVTILGAGSASTTDNNKNDTKQSQQTEKTNKTDNTEKTNNNKTPTSSSNGATNNSAPAEKTKSPVTISEWSWREFAGGDEWNFKFTNNTDKTIKYITLGWDCYNAVVYDQSTYKSSMSAQYTGPLEPGETTTFLSHTFHLYSCSFQSTKLTKLQVEFMDGTVIHVTDDLYTDIIVKD